MNYEKHLIENNPIAYAIMDNSFKNKKVPHAYLFTAMSGQEIKNEYLYLIQRLISNDEPRMPETYPDLVVIDGSDKLIKKEFVVEALTKLSQTALDSAGIKILLIKNIENSNKQSINTLLKFLEEPTKDTYIILTTNQDASVLPTIRSRTQTIKLRPLRKLKMAMSLQEEGIGTKIAFPISAIASSIENAFKIYKNDFEAIYQDIINSLTECIKNKNQTILSLSKLIMKKNYKLFISLLREFFNDVWRIKEMTTLSFKGQEKLLDKYLTSNFNYYKAIKSLSNFEVMLSKNVNFDLFKNKLLIELEECYV